MITILELAEELHASKSTVNRKIKDLGLKGALEFSDGKYYLNDKQAEQVRRTMTRTSAGRGVNHEGGGTVHHDAHHEESGDKQLIEDLLRQLKAKDEQIKELHGIIEQHQVVIDQQQKLNLISQQRLLALEQKQAEPPKRGLFARLFKKDSHEPGAASVDPAGEEPSTTNA